jgi:hypothetical protein
MRRESHRPVLPFHCIASHYKPAVAERR